MRKEILLFLSLVIIDGLAYPYTVEHRVAFDRRTVQFSAADGYDVATMAGLGLENIPGRPLLPVRTLNLLLPDGAMATSVEVTVARAETLAGRFYIAPGRREAPLSESGAVAGAVPNPAIYGSDAGYPEQAGRLAHQGSMAGFRMVSVALYPLRYLPKTGTLIINTEMNVTIRCEFGKGNAAVRGTRVGRSMAQNIAANSQALDMWYPITAFGQKSDSTIDYIIISAAGYDTTLQRLADWKRQKGVKARVVTTDSIYGNFSGADHQEQIRNFLMQAASAWGTSYVLLAGDTAQVPARVVYGAASGYDSLYPGRDSLRADLYYGDLDGSWNADGDGIWGELEDSVDMYPDLVVGRAPINTVADAQTFVTKVLTYEQNPDRDYLDKASFWAESLDYYSDGGRAKDIIDRDYLSPFFKPPEKLYETLGNETRSSVLDAYRQGRHLINHMGHAWYGSMNVGPGYTNVHEIRNGDFDTIPCGTAWGILYSVGCMTAAIERSCIAEHYVNSAAGGGVAFIGNSSYGWYLPYFPGYASSDLYDQQFFHELLAGQSPSLGQTHTAAKAAFVGQAQAENEYRWVMYDLNLLGDPELPVWTDQPESLVLACSDSLPAGTVRLPVIVLNGGAPTAGALVCLSGDSTYARGRTDAAGQLVLTGTASAGDTLVLTASGRNCLPVTKAITIFPQGAHLSCRGWHITELAGNGDGLPGPGEELSLSLLVANDGSFNTGDSVRVLVQAADSLSVISDSIAWLGAIPPGDSAWTSGGLACRIDSSASDGMVARLQVWLEDSSGNQWGQQLGLAVAAPKLGYSGYQLDDRAAGNGNGIPEAGETVKFYINIVNTGSTATGQVQALLGTADPFIAVPDSGDSIGPIAPDSTMTAEFLIEVSPSLPGPVYAPEFLMQSSSGWLSWRDSFAVAMGQVGFADDMEAGPDGWYATLPESSEGGWHLSQIRSNSPSHAWYFGSEDDTLMPAYSMDTLETPAFAIGPRCRLGFWQWHSFTPGWSWGVTELCGDFGARLLTTADGQSPGWELEQFDLAAYTPGTMLSVRFIAVCDSFRSEGWYIDDFAVAGGALGVSGEPARPAILDRFRIISSQPNPFLSAASIRYQLPKASAVSFRIYNLLGQLVRSADAGFLPPGMHSAEWDGRDRDGRAAPSGIYFLVIRADDDIRSLRVLKLK